MRINTGRCSTANKNHHGLGNQPDYYIQNQSAATPKVRAWLYSVIRLRIDVVASELDILEFSF